MVGAFILLGKVRPEIKRGAEGVVPGRTGELTSFRPRQILRGRDRASSGRIAECAGGAGAGDAPRAAADFDTMCVKAASCRSILRKYGGLPRLRPTGPTMATIYFCVAPP